MTIDRLHLAELVEEELNRKLDAAQKASPTKRRQESLQRDLTRVRKSMERLMTAYQEDLLSLDELRSRMPNLRPTVAGHAGSSGARLLSGAERSTRSMKLQTE
jgi:site-specific DNA recombinase